MEPSDKTPSNEEKDSTVRRYNHEVVANFPCPPAELQSAEKNDSREAKSLNQCNIIKFYNEVQPNPPNGDTVAGKKMQKLKINRNIRPQSDKALKTTTEQIDVKPHSSTFADFTYDKEDYEQDRIDSLVIFSMGLKEIVQEKTELMPMRRQCEKLLKKINKNIPKKNHYRLTCNCIDITNALIKICMLSLAEHYLHTSTKLNKTLKVEFLPVAKRLSISCFNLAAELKRQHKEHDVKVCIVPKFLAILSNVKESDEVNDTAKVNFYREVLDEYLRADAPMRDEAIIKWCRDSLAYLKDADESSLLQFNIQIQKVKTRNEVKQPLYRSVMSKMAFIQSEPKGKK